MKYKKWSFVMRETIGRGHSKHYIMCIICCTTTMHYYVWCKITQRPLNSPPTSYSGHNHNHDEDDQNDNLDGHADIHAACSRFFRDIARVVGLLVQRVRSVVNMSWKTNVVTKFRVDRGLKKTNIFIPSRSSRRRVCILVSSPMATAWWCSLSTPDNRNLA